MAYDDFSDDAADADAAPQAPTKPFTATLSDWADYNLANTKYQAQLAAAAPNAGDNDISPEDGQGIADKAKEWNGTPYAPKRTPLAGPNARKSVGADCSGSVYKIYEEAGHPYPYATSDQFIGAAEGGKIPFREVDHDDARPGDAVVYDGASHMSVYARNDHVYSAHQPGTSFRFGPAGVFAGEPRYFRKQKGNQPN